ncbi:MAG: response regulator, partial [Verrucomicrobiales bacterium]|nr:response regulator [Verrucomicrobiales bacterium]
GELQQHNARGEPIVVESRATLIRDLHAQPHQVLFINTDITERKRLQDQFLRAQRRESIGALAGGMAHDLNNALSPILMGIQMLKARAGDDAMRRMLAIMESNTQRGAGMVRQVLLFSRGQEAVTGPVHLPALLRELEAVLRQSFPPAIEIIVLAPADLWTLQGNPTQLQQILLNLCLNARDAMPSGGRLTLAGDNADLTADELADLPNLRPGRHLMLLVSDTGTGIPPEIQARLFEPFFTTKPPGIGTGLGLATVASLVKAHGGSLRVRSTPGEGTTFEIYLPAASAAAATITAPDTAAPAAVRGSGQKILVVDDEISVREMLCEGLTAQGYAVLAASSGLEALALARQHREDLRLVITDWSLPVLGGEGLAGQLRAERPDLPLLLVSGTLSHAPELPALPGAPPLLLAKPFRFEDLLARIEQALADPARPSGST